MLPISLAITTKFLEPDVFSTIDPDYPFRYERHLRVTEILLTAIGDDGQAYDYEIKGALDGKVQRRPPKFPEHYLSVALENAKHWDGEPSKEEALAVAFLLQRWAQADDEGRLPRPLPPEDA